MPLKLKNKFLLVYKMNYIFNFNPLLQNLFHEKNVIEIEVDEIELHENLNIFTTESKNRLSILQSLKEPITKQGVIYLQKRLSQSRTLDEIKREQKEIMFLLKNPKILNTIYTTLKKIKDHENDILWCIAEKSCSDSDHLSCGYFQHEFLRFLNRYNPVLFLLNVFTLLIAPIYATFSPVIIAIMPYFYFKLFTKIPVSFLTYMKIAKNIVFKVPKISSIKKMSLFSILTKLLSWLIYGQSVYSNAKTSERTKKILNEIQLKLESVQKTLRYNRILISSLNETPIEHTLKDYSHIFDRKTRPFEKVTNSYFHDWSLLLSEYNKITQFTSVKDKIKTDIKQMYTSWGRIDYLVSLCRTLINGNWCIPFIRKKETPYLSITDMYHPSIQNSCITNSITLDNEHMLITGPNASGKSTLLKSVAISVFLAHRLGISPGKHMETSYFRHIYTHLNIQDAVGKESLFQREANKIKKQIQMMNTLPGLHFSIIDELFHSTNPGEAVKGAKWILSQINDNNNTMCLVSTHFHELTDECEELNKFKRFCIPFIRNDKGEINYTYTLKEGVSEQNIALEMLQKTED